LSDNVAEWTATRVGDEKFNPRRGPADANPSSDESGELYWVAGGSFDLANFDFSVADRRRATWNGASVGFRCALSATELMRSSTDEHPRIRFSSRPVDDSAEGARRNSTQQRTTP